MTIVEIVISWHVPILYKEEGRWRFRKSAPIVGFTTQDFINGNFH